MSKEAEALDNLKEQAGAEAIENDAFKNFKQKDEKEEEATLSDISHEIDEMMNIPNKTIEEKMEELGMSKDIAIDMIMMLSDNGFITEKISLFGGKFEAVFKTAKLADSKNFVEMFDEMNINTQAKGEYYLNLYSLASILVSFRDTEAAKK